MEYIPDKWILLRMEINGKPITKVYANWYGGYREGDSWRINSGISKYTETDNYYIFYGNSGSIYNCYKDNIGTNRYGDNILDNILNQAKEKGHTITVFNEIEKIKEVLINIKKIND